MCIYTVTNIWKEPYTHTQYETYLEESPLPEGPYRFRFCQGALAPNESSLPPKPKQAPQDFLAGNLF